MANITSASLARKLWLHSALVLAVLIFVYSITGNAGIFGMAVLIISPVATIVGSLPALLVLLIVLPLLKRFVRGYNSCVALLLAVIIVIAVAFCTAGALIIENPFREYASFQGFIETVGFLSAFVLTATFISFFINLKYIRVYFSSSIKKIPTMEENYAPAFEQTGKNSLANKTWLKALITGGLILVMLIPIAFVVNLIEERQQRQEDVKKEVSSKWAGSQSITFPYLYIPYHVIVSNKKDTSFETRSFLVLPDNLAVTGAVEAEQRKRSIYKVLLYNSTLNAKGNFKIQIPEGVDAASIDWANAKLCTGISDFKGILQKITARVNNIAYDLSAGLPTNDIDTNGLSTPVPLSADAIGKEITFEMPLKIKGSDQLHFVPLAGNSQFSLSSNWNSPSFDGNTLPAERNLDNKGFEASWNFNKANLPFNTVLKDFNFKKDDYAFGVSLLQPADQYSKTMRCVKYAILFIGLSFSLFFIVEIMQKKPFHPVQYVLVGLALVIFYTLLLSISEFLQFDTAYLIAAAATVLLITFYAKSHFKSWKTASVFTGVIGFIYGFIFVLIRLEDTALLVGSIGLFIILALAMYASRKINWYGNSVSATPAI